jgi:hypothetical protein
VGTSPLHGFSFGIAPRLGVFVPVDGDWFFDVSARHALFGIEGLSGHIGFGTWDNF